LKGSTLGVSTAEKHSGTYSYSCTTPGAGGYEGVGTAYWTESSNVATPNTTDPLTASVWVKAPLDATMRLTVVERGATVGDLAVVLFTGTGAWQRVSGSGSLTTAADRLEVRVSTDPSAQAITFYVDDVLVEVSTDLGPYFDGNTAWTGDRSYAWTGTPNESTSVQRDTPASLTLLDTFPTIFGTNSYKVTTISADGATADTLITMVTAEGEWGFLSTGEGFSQIVKFGGNFALEATPTVDSTLFKAAGRTRPIALYGTTGDLVVTGSCLVADGFGSTADELEAFLLIPGKAGYRDPSGRRIRGLVTGQVARQNSLLGTFNYTVTETS